MDFRVEDEIRVIQKVVKHVHGPCLMCNRETEYGNRIPRLGMVWLRKQFEPDARLRNMRAVRIGVAPKTRSLAVLEALICKACRAGATEGTVGCLPRARCGIATESRANRALSRCNGRPRL